MFPVIFTLFGYPVRSYGVFMTLAHLVGIFSLLWIARRRHEPLGPYLDLLFAVILFGILGARLGYAYVRWDEFQAHPASLLSFWKGGLSFYGGFPLAFLAFLAVLRRHRIPVLPTADAVSPVLPLSLGLIRLGCFLQGCCYGAPTTLPWAVRFSRPEGKVPAALLAHPLHPSQLYEASFLFLLAAFLAWAVRRNSLRPGLLATFSIFAYAVYRFAADFLRGDLDRGFAGVTWLAPTQAAALLGILATPFVVAICLRVPPREP